MRVNFYDKVAMVSVALNEKINELKNCQKEKENLLLKIEQYQKTNQLNAFEDEIRQSMANNLNKFKQIIRDLEDLKTLV